MTIDAINVSKISRMPRIAIIALSLLIAEIGCIGAEPDMSSDIGQLQGTSVSLTSSEPAWEAEALARERGIPLKEAQRRMHWQDLAPTLADKAKAGLGDRFGGIWIDVSDGDRVKIGMADRAISAATDAAVRGLASSIGLEDGYDIVPVQYSMATLQQANDWLGVELERVNTNTDATLMAGLRPDLNAVELQYPAKGVLSKGQQDLIATASARFGSLLYISTYTGKPTALAGDCSYPYCNLPERGGIRITSQSNTSCTFGFAARSRVDPNILLVVTAGHCNGPNPDDQIWKSRDKSGTVLPIGVGWEYEFDSDGDVMTIYGWGDSYLTPPYVYVTSGPDTTLDERYTIHDTATSVVGMRICTTGSWYGRSDCGTVTQLGATLKYNGKTVKNLGRGSYCTVDGDSGAPMYASHHAYGITVANCSECDSFYQGIRGAQNDLKFDLLTQ